MSGVAGYAGWRWIFILEGLATVVLGIAAKFLVVDWPETATFLNEEERDMLIRRLKSDRGETRMDRLDKPARRRVFTDPKLYLGYVALPSIILIYP